MVAYAALVLHHTGSWRYLADRYLGAQGGCPLCLLSLWPFLMAFEENGSGQANPAIIFFWLALAFIIVRLRDFESNISGHCRSLYNTHRHSS